MKKYQLCGLGNGLLDVQHEVKDEVLQSLKLNKGEMKLVSTEEQNVILKSINSENPNFCSGGSAANTVIGFAKFGGKAAYMTSLGNDDNGHFYAREFRELGIDLKTSFLSESTGTCLVLITPDSERTMNTCLGASAMFSSDMVDEQLIKDSEWVYIEGYKLTAELSSDAVFSTIELAKKHNTKVAFTFSDVFVVQFFYENVRKVAMNSDLIFCNELEALAFTKQDNAHSAFENLCLNIPNVAMTMGKNGSKVKWDNKVYNIPSFPVKAIDSTGAGDMFAGAFMYGILYTGNPLYAGTLGSYSASKIVASMGARLETDYHAMKTEIRNRISLIKK